MATYLFTQMGNGLVIGYKKIFIQILFTEIYNIKAIFTERQNEKKFIKLYCITYTFNILLNCCQKNFINKIISINFLNFVYSVLISIGNYN